jgi:hypothetical protein
MFDRKLGGGGNFFPLHSTGAQVQRPLWASTGVKNPNYSDTMYVDGLMGPDTVDTIPEATLAAYSDHGNPGSDLTNGLEEAQAQVKALADAGVSLDSITDDLLAAGVAAFAEAAAIAESAGVRRVGVDAIVVVGAGDQEVPGRGFGRRKRLDWAVGIVCSLRGVATTVGPSGVRH